MLYYATLRLLGVDDEAVNLGEPDRRNTFGKGYCAKLPNYCSLGHLYHYISVHFLQDVPITRSVDRMKKPSVAAGSGAIFRCN